MPTNVLVLNKSWLVTGAGDPEGMQEAPVGSLFLREDGGDGTSLYIKETGDGVTGWKPFKPERVVAANRVLGRDGSGDGPVQDLLLTPSLKIINGALEVVHQTLPHAPAHAPGGADPLVELPAHAGLHGVGGSDPIPVTPAPPLPHAATHAWGGSDPIIVVAEPTPHASTHAPGGTDQVTAIPVKHAAGHQPGGLDALTALDAGVLTTGQVADARLPANLARKTIDNNFAASQTLPSGSTIVGANSLLNLQDTSSPAETQKWRMLGYGNGNFYLESMTAAGAIRSRPWVAEPSGNIIIGGHALVGGGIYERGRGLALGEWLDHPFNAGDYYAASGGTWTVGAPAVVRNRYTVIGKTLIWSLYISWYSGSNVLTIGTVPTICIRLPAGYQTIGSNQFVTGYAVDGGRTDVDVGTGTSDARFTRRDAQNWTGNAPGIITTLTLEIN